MVKGVPRRDNRCERGIVIRIIDSIEVAAHRQSVDLRRRTVRQVKRQGVPLPQTVLPVKVLLHGVRPSCREFPNDIHVAVKGIQRVVGRKIRTAVFTEHRLHGGADGAAHPLDRFRQMALRKGGVHHVQKVGDIYLLAVRPFHERAEQRTVLNQCFVVIPLQRIALRVGAERPVGVVRQKIPLAVHSVHVGEVLTLGGNVPEDPVIILRPVTVIRVGKRRVKLQVATDVQPRAKCGVCFVVCQIKHRKVVHFVVVRQRVERAVALPVGQLRPLRSVKHDKFAPIIVAPVPIFEVIVLIRFMNPVKPVERAVHVDQRGAHRFGKRKALLPQKHLHQLVAHIGAGVIVARIAHDQLLKAVDPRAVCRIHGFEQPRVAKFPVRRVVGGACNQPHGFLRIGTRISAVQPPAGVLIEPYRPVGIVQRDVHGALPVASVLISVSVMENPPLTRPQIVVLRLNTHNADRKLFRNLPPGKIGAVIHPGQLPVGILHNGGDGVCAHIFPCLQRDRPVQALPALGCRDRAVRRVIDRAAAGRGQSERATAGKEHRPLLVKGKQNFVRSVRPLPRRPLPRLTRRGVTRARHTQESQRRHPAKENQDKQDAQALRGSKAVVKFHPTSPVYSTVSALSTPSMASRRALISRRFSFIRKDAVTS